VLLNCAGDLRSDFRRYLFAPFPSGKNLLLVERLHSDPLAARTAHALSKNMLRYCYLTL
jgi:hypothetical protein